MGISTQLLSDLASSLVGLKNTLLILVKNSSKKVVSETVTILAGQTKIYDVATLLGANSAEYDIQATNVRVRAKDPYSTSPTYNMFINSEAVVTTALSDTSVNVYNNTNLDLTVQIFVEVPRLTI